MTDLLIRGARVLDPGAGLDGEKSLLIRDGKVEALLSPGESAAGAEVVDAQGCLVTPGLIDFHAHFYPGTELGFDPDEVYPQMGVTAACDPGSTGASNFPGFRRWVLERSPLTLRALLHISALGLAGFPRMPDLAWRGLVDEAALVKAFDEHSDWLLGVKLRYQEDQLGELGVDSLSLAARLARRVGKPLLVHVTGAPEPMREYLRHFQAGDVVVHPYHNKGPGILLDERGRVCEAAMSARERGVLFDVGRARGHFDWKVAEAAASEAFWPDIISTDMTIFSRDDEAVRLPGVMAQFLHLGMSLPAVVEQVTARPAAAMGLAGQIGTIRPGARADLAVLRVEERAREVADGAGTARVIRPWLQPVRTYLAGRLAFAAPTADPS